MTSPQERERRAHPPDLPRTSSSIGQHAHFHVGSKKQGWGGDAYRRQTKTKSVKMPASQTGEEEKTQHEGQDNSKKNDIETVDTKFLSKIDALSLFQTLHTTDRQTISHELMIHVQGEAESTRLWEHDVEITKCKVVVYTHSTLLPKQHHPKIPTS